MSILDDLLAAIRGVEEQQTEAEIAEAVEAKRQLQDLQQHPGWTRLVDHLTAAMEAVYDKIGNGGMTADDMAFIRFGRLVRKGPQQLLEDAQAIITAARMRRGR